MNSKAKGEVSEAKVIAALVAAGFSVSIPFGDNQRYDLIVDDEGLLIKVQVKTANYKNGCIEFCSASHNGFTGVRKSYLDEVDLFMVYSPKLDQVYVMPVEDKKVITLRVEPNKGGATSKIRWAKDYQFDADTSPGGLGTLIRFSMVGSSPTSASIYVPPECGVPLRNCS